jgi:hypothetical protein
MSLHDNRIDVATRLARRYRDKLREILTGGETLSDERRRDVATLYRLARECERDAAQAEIEFEHDCANVQRWPGFPEDT